MSTPFGTASWKRWLVAWVVVLLTVVSGVRVGFAADRDPAPATETTPAPEPTVPTYRSPVDQPRATGPGLKLPAIPASFNTRDAGWIHFSYPPSTRERVEPLIRDADKIRAELAVRLGQQ